MAKSPRYTVRYRRKREIKTDYNLRLKLLKSRSNRLIIRRSIKYFTLQLVKYEVNGDRVLNTVTSKELPKLGWKFSTSNIPAAYLSGLLMAKKSKEKDAIADFGLNRLVKGGALYAALKGAIDGGMKINHSKEIFPKEDRIKGEHIKNYGKNKEDIVKNFEEVKNKILKM